MKEDNMRYSLLIILLICVNLGCKSNDKSSEETFIEYQIENTSDEIEETVDEIESLVPDPFEEDMLFGTWKLVEGEPPIDKLIDSAYLNFYDNLYFNKKVNGYYTPRVPFSIRSSKIHLSNSMASRDLAEILSVNSDTLKLHLITDNAVGIFVRTESEE